MPQKKLETVVRQQSVDSPTRQVLFFLPSSHYKFNGIKNVVLNSFAEVDMLLVFHAAVQIVDCCLALI